jgi:Rrf2 family protein
MPAGDGMHKLLRIPESISLALHAMAVLVNRSGEVIPTREIAELLEVSSAHLAKVLNKLEHMGYVESTRGPAGGFQLAGNADDITLMDIYVAIEGPLDTEGCLLASSPCGGDVCIFGEILQSLDAQFRERLAGTRLSELKISAGVNHA